MMDPSRAFACLAAVSVVGAVTTRAFAVTQREFIDSSVVLPSAVSNIAGAVLPERSAIGQGYLSNAYSPNIVVTAACKVKVTFVHEGAGYLNSLGYFTYTTTGSGVQILDRQLVFPNASYADPNKGWGGGTLVSGDTVTLRTSTGDQRVFDPGTQIGFFLVSDGWNGAGVKGWTDASPALPYNVPASNASHSVFTTLDELNPEQSTGRLDVARHVAMVQVAGISGFLGGYDFFLTGFEDQRRDIGSDNDFNDVMVIVHATPETAIQGVNVQQYDSVDPDPDHDGVTGLLDLFPNDPSRAFITRTPASGYQTLVFEDTYPSVGDADYNDVVVQYAMQEVTSASGTLKDLIADFHLVARGAGFDHRFGLSIPGIPSQSTGALAIERFDTNGLHSTDPMTTLAGFLRSDGAGGTVLRLDQIFPSTTEALPALPGEQYTNTLNPVASVLPASTRVVVTFDQALVRAPLGAVPFDPFIQVIHGQELYDVHLPGKMAFPNRPAGLPVESGTTAFLDGGGMPWAMLVPYDWRFPLEKVRIETPYVAFDAWAASYGKVSNDWYKTPALSAQPTVADKMSDQSRTRAWILYP